MLAAAADLFYRHGIRAVGVEAIAEAAGTNKMTLYRHFASKDELVAEYLRESAKLADACWDRFEQAHPGDARRSCAPGSRRWRATSPAPTSAAARSPTLRSSCRKRITRRGGSSRSSSSRSARGSSSCAAPQGLSEPDMLADELYLLLEGARVTAQSVGADGLGARLVRMGEAMIAAHAPGSD